MPRMHPRWLIKYALMFAASIFNAGGAPAMAFDWPTARGAAGGLGTADGKLPKEPKVLWEFQTEDDGAGFEGTPVIYDDKIFVADFEGSVYALELSTGQVAWKIETDDGFVTGAACQNGRVVLGDFNAFVYCLDTNTGAQIWKVELDQPIVSGATFFKDLVLLSSDSGSLYALSLETGEQKWLYETGDQLRSSASLWKETAMLGGCDSKLHCIDASNGEPKREGVPLKAPTLSTPNILEDIAVIPTQPGSVLAIDLNTSDVLWEYKPDGGMNTDIRGSSATLASLVDGKMQGIVVVPSRNRRLAGLDASNGKLLWEAILRKRSDSSPVICDGRAWIGTTDGMVYGIDLSDGSETWSYQLAGSIIASPAVSKGKIVIATEKGAVVCFGE